MALLNESPDGVWVEISSTSVKIRTHAPTHLLRRRWRAAATSALIGLPLTFNLALRWEWWSVAAGLGVGLVLLGLDALPMPRTIRFDNGRLRTGGLDMDFDDVLSVEGFDDHIELETRTGTHTLRFGKPEINHWLATVLSEEAQRWDQPEPQLSADVGAMMERIKTVHQVR